MFIKNCVIVYFLNTQLITSYNLLYSTNVLMSIDTIIKGYIIVYGRLERAHLLTTESGDDVLKKKIEYS